MTGQNTPAPQERMLVIGTVSFYMVAALSMVVANKWVLATSNVPLFFLLSQLLIAVVLFGLSHAFGFISLPMHINYQICKGLAPMIVLNVVGLSFSNFTLKYVDASFYQVARGLVLPFTVLTSSVILASRPSRPILLACTIVTLGFLTGVLLDNVAVSSLGIFFGVASSAVTALHAVVIKRAMSLPAINNSALALCWYTNLLSSGLLAIVVLFSGEVPSVLVLLSGTNASDNGALGRFVWGSLITGVFGFLMGIASLLSIKVTSPITHMVSSAVRGVAASFLGVWIFGDIISSGRAASIAIILGGSIYYTWVKHVESQSPSNPSSTASPTSNGEKAYERVPLDELEAGRKEERTKPE